MVDYYAEVFSKKKKDDFSERIVRYQRECAKEIEEIISKNSIRFDDFFIGEKIRLYSPLKELSKIKLDENEPFHKVRELFRSSANYYNSEMSNLFWNDYFVVYDKNERENTLKISEKPKNCLDIFPAWIDFRYFEKGKSRGF